jgi:hypothetical protein
MKATRNKSYKRMLLVRWILSLQQFCSNKRKEATQKVGGTDRRHAGNT